MDIIINDTNILIDLYTCGILEEFFSLPYKFHTTDFVVGELEDKAQRERIIGFCDRGMLEVKSFSSKEILTVYEYYEEARTVCNISVPDCSVLIYAKSIDRARLLTGDKTLRKRAEREGVNVSGILFVFDELVKQGIITRKFAFERLSLLVEKNVRLPKNEVEKRLEIWNDGL